jgi:putative hydrolase of the HAD superfamily
MDIRALLFDINSTLIDIETDERMEEVYRSIAHLLTYQGIGLRRWAVQDLYFQVMKEQFERSAEVYPEFNVVEVWREILHRSASTYTHSLPAEKLQQLPLLIAELQRGNSRKRLCLYPRVTETLDQLKKRYRLAVVSDAQTVYALPELRAVGLCEYFDPIIISGDYGYRKPDPRLFQKALDALEVHPSQAIFVGNDRFRDVFGAKQLGMKTVWFCNSQDSGRSEAAVPDYIIYDFAQVSAAIDFLAAQ